MPLRRRTRPVVFVSLLASVLVVAAPPSSAAVPLPTRDAARQRDVARIHRHFDSVLTELAARDMRALSPAQRDRRAALVVTLRAYDARGDFPRNHDFPGRMVPYFVDRGTGVRCAVAHLLASTGRHDLVDRIARTDNNVWVAALAGDTAFTAWLDRHGLTLEEAARIQVPYDGGPSMSTAVPIIATGGAITVLGALGTGIWNATSNRDGHNGYGTGFGAISGFVTALIGGGIVGSAEGDRVRSMGAAIGVAGGVSLVLAVKSMHRQHRAIAERRKAGAPADANAKARLETSFSPILPVSRDGGAGVSVQIRF